MQVRYVHYLQAAIPFIDIIKYNQCTVAVATEFSINIITRTKRGNYILLKNIENICQIINYSVDYILKFILWRENGGLTYGKPITAETSTNAGLSGYHPSGAQN